MMPDQWEVQWVPIAQTTRLPEGWEPCGGTREGVWIKRRVVAGMVRPPPAGVLSAEERAVLRRRQVAGGGGQ